MKKLARSVVLSLMVAISTAVAANCVEAQWAMRLADHKVISFESMLDEIRGSKLIFVGEIHDRKEHHVAQLDVIKALKESGAPLAIGLEMFTAESQDNLDQWVAGNLDLDDFIKLYNREWKIPWPLYHDIFIYAREQHIPLIGLNVPREIIHKVAQEGFAALTPDQRKMLPAGITCNVDPTYKAFIQKAYMMGHTINDKSFVYFCESQMLWNKSLGWHLKEYLKQNPGRTVIVLAGLGHAMKAGIPEEIFRGTRFGYKVLLPELPGLVSDTITTADADYLLLFEQTDNTEGAR